MDKIATTKMSSKGQVVIPESIRNTLGFRPGDQFLVVGKGDAVVLKALTPPAGNDFDDLLREARKQARDAGIQEKIAKRKRRG